MAVEVTGLKIRGADIVLWFQDPEYPHGLASICHTYGEPLVVPGRWAGWELVRVDFGESVGVHREIAKAKREVAA